MTGKVISINISEKTSVIKEPVKQALFVAGFGIKGDGHAGSKGFVLNRLTVGTSFKIGETIQEITEIGKKGHDKFEIIKLFGAYILPVEGIFTKVIKGGIVKVGDKIEIIKKEVI